MKISLIYNATAGRGVSAEELVAALLRAGHEVLHVLHKTPDVARARADGATLVVAAGGDGTVARAARTLAGTGLPLAILPLGTANNIARSLGLHRPLGEAIERWRQAHPLRLDLGWARGPWGERRFVEAVGGGWLPTGIAAMDDDPEAEDEEPEASLARAVRTYRAVLADLRPRRVRLVVDGESSEEELLLLEVVNMPSVGARVLASPGASPTDGLLDVVVATEAHRDEIEASLRRRIEGGSEEDVRLALPVRRGRHVRIVGWDALHVDDRVHRDLAEAGVDLRVDPGAVEILVDRGSGAAIER
jgi:diacylglycerol kinase (ATP)